MADVKFKQIPPNATSAEICRYINNFIEELTFILNNLDEDNTLDAYATKSQTQKDIKKAMVYSSTETDEKIKKLSADNKRQVQ